MKKEGKGGDARRQKKVQDLQIKATSQNVRLLGCAYKTCKNCDNCCSSTP
jgi:hypothetical protein